MEARAKWDAWNSVKVARRPHEISVMFSFLNVFQGMSKEDAMKQYMEIVTKGDANWRVSCCPGSRHSTVAVSHA